MKKPSNQTFKAAVEKTYMDTGNIVLAFKLESPARSGYATYEVSGFWEWFDNPWIATKKTNMKELLAWVDALNSYLPKGQKVDRDKVAKWNKGFKLYKCVHGAAK